jgi:hypothetical protein
MAERMLEDGMGADGGGGTMAFWAQPRIRSVGAILGIGMQACLLRFPFSLPAAEELNATRRTGTRD